MPISINSLTRPGFDLEAAVLLAHASERAYRDSSSVSQWAQRRGLGQMRAFDKANTQGYWAANDDVALLAFRGTSNLGHWWRDARLAPVADDWGVVHQGFHEGLEAVKGELDFFAETVEKRASETVWIAGHSLGGALALLAGAYLRRTFGVVPRIMTFGQPRVGGGEFADRFAAELPGALTRVVNQSDIITRLPPEYVGYRHTGAPKRIVRPGVMESMRGNAKNPLEWMEGDLPELSVAEFEAVSRQLEQDGEQSGDGVREGAVPMIRDHSIVVYIGRLIELQDARASES